MPLPLIGRSYGLFTDLIDEGFVVELAHQVALRADAATVSGSRALRMAATALNVPAPTSTKQPVCVERTFRRTREAVPRTRRFVREAITDHVPDDRMDDILVCASELATNALQHTPPGRMFRVHVTLSPDILRLEVHDAGDDMPQVREATENDDRGRGLLLVATLADGWGTSRRDGPGKIVRAAFRLADAEPNA